MTFRPETEQWWTSWKWGLSYSRWKWKVSIPFFWCTIFSGAFDTQKMYWFVSLIVFPICLLGKPLALRIGVHVIVSYMYIYIYIIYSISTYYTFAGRLAAETLGQQNWVQTPRYTFKPPFPNHRFDWSKGNYLLGNHPIYDVKSFHDPHYIY